MGLLPAERGRYTIVDAGQRMESEMYAVGPGDTNRKGDLRDQSREKARQAYPATRKRAFTLRLRRSVE